MSNKQQGKVQDFFRMDLGREKGWELNCFLTNDCNLPDNSLGTLGFSIAQLMSELFYLCRAAISG